MVFFRASLPLTLFTLLALKASAAPLESRGEHPLVGSAATYPKDPAKVANGHPNIALDTNSHPYYAAGKRDAFFDETQVQARGEDGDEMAVARNFGIGGGFYGGYRPYYNQGGYGGGNGYGNSGSSAQASASSGSQAQGGGSGLGGGFGRRDTDLDSDMERRWYGGSYPGSYGSYGNQFGGGQGQGYGGSSSNSQASASSNSGAYGGGRGAGLGGSSSYYKRTLGNFNGGGGSASYEADSRFHKSGSQFSNGYGNGWQQGGAGSYGGGDACAFGQWNGGNWQPQAYCSTREAFSSSSSDYESKGLNCFGWGCSAASQDIEQSQAQHTFQQQCQSVGGNYWTV